MGWELVLQLIRMGASVAAADINEGSLKETVALSGSENVSAPVVDISDRAALLIARKMNGLLADQHPATLYALQRP